MIVHDGNRIKFFQSDGHINQYIPKKNKELIEKLAYKKYIHLRLDYIKKKLKLGNCLQKSLSVADEKYSRFLADLKKCHILQHIESESHDLRQWMFEEYEHNPKYPEKLVHDTVYGMKVRSKSESLIAIVLSQMNIAFRYECRLDLQDGITIYPDFTIKHPVTGELIYYEHFGIMDDPEYVARTYRKIQMYMDNGIFPMRHLIMTFEDINHPLNVDVIEKTLSVCLWS